MSSFGLEDHFPSPPMKCNLCDTVSELTGGDEDDSLTDDEDLIDWYDRLLNPSKRLYWSSNVSGLHGQTFIKLSCFNSLVRAGNGEVVSYDELRGKYLLIFCISLPVLAGSVLDKRCRALITTYSELKRYCFEMVLVPIFNTYSSSSSSSSSCQEEEVLFNHFLSAFSCPAVSFSHSESRSELWSYVSFKDQPLSYILVDSQNCILDHYCSPDLFTYYGSEGFPFSPSSLESVHLQDHILRLRLDPVSGKCYRGYPDHLRKDSMKPVSLHEDILQCDPSFLLNRIGQPSSKACSVSELSQKYVGLYLCIDGALMQTLHDVYNRCRDNNKELEIVLVCLPVFDLPNIYYQYLTKALELCGVTSWLIFPFDNKVCRRLWRAFADGGREDSLVILPPTHMKSYGELCGRAVVMEFGAKGYPFIRDTLADQIFTTLRSVTPASLFNTSILYKHGEQQGQSVIEGKKLLLYLDWKGKCELYPLLKRYYPALENINCEIVFIPLDDGNSAQEHEYFGEMKWLFMHANDSKRDWVIKQLLYENEDYYAMLIAVDVHGRIVSKDVTGMLMTSGVTESLFDDILKEEIVYHLNELGPHLG